MGAPLIWLGSTAITALRNTIGDPSGATQTRWTDAELAAYLNRGQLQVTLDEPRMFLTEWTLSTADGTREYALPPSWVATQSVQLIRTANSDIVQLQNVSYETYQTWVLGDETAEAEPNLYYVWRKLGADPTTHQPPSLFLHPTPDAVYSLRIVGFKMPDDIAADTSKVMELEALFVEAAIMYAASLAMFDDDDLGRRDRFMVEYEKMADKVTGAIDRRDYSRVSRLMPKGGRGRQIEGDIDTLIRWG